MVDADKFNRAMKRQKAAVDAGIARADTEAGLVVLLTGDGKAKTTSAFGMVMRALGHGMKTGVVQFIKGTQLSGEEVLLRERFPEVDFYQMGTGFTWDTQNHAADKAAAESTWQHALRMLSDPSFELVVLDELTYMIGFGFLEEQDILGAIRARPSNQHVIITGRGGGAALKELADTVSEVRAVKHAFDSGMKARPGVDF